MLAAPAPGVLHDEYEPWRGVAPEAIEAWVKFAFICVLLGVEAPADPANEGRSLGQAQSRSYVKKLVAALQHDSSFKVRLQATVLLGRSGSQAASSALIDALKGDRHPTVRAAAATSLAQLQELKAIVPILERLSLDPDDFVRREAKLALESYDPDLALPYVISMFGEFRSSVRVSIRETSLKYVLENASGTDLDRALERALGDFKLIRDIATKHLIGMEDQAHTLSVLKRATLNKEPAVRRNALRVLSELNTKDATQMILEVYQRDTELEEVKSLARLALRMRRSFLDVDAIVQESQFSGRKQTRGRALKLLGVIGGPQAEAILVKSLSDPDIYVRGNAVLALRWLGSTAVIPRLETLAKDSVNQRISHLIRETLDKLRNAKRGI